MTRAQEREAEKVLPLLAKCREHLDTAMYGLGEIPEGDYERLHRIHDHICKALNEFQI